MRWYNSVNKRESFYHDTPDEDCDFWFKSRTNSTSFKYSLCSVHAAVNVITSLKIGGGGEGEGEISIHDYINIFFFFYYFCWKKHYKQLLTKNTEAIKFWEVFNGAARFLFGAYTFLSSLFPLAIYVYNLKNLLFYPVESFLEAKLDSFTEFSKFFFEHNCHCLKKGIVLKQLFSLVYKTSICESLI